jgi:hypothetical protein
MTSSNLTELSRLADRFAAVAERHGATDLHLIAVRAAGPHSGSHPEPRLPTHLRGAPPACDPRELVIDDRRVMLYFFGDPSLLRAFDALSLRAGDIIDPPEGVGYAYDQPFLQLGRWPIGIINTLKSKGADHLIRSSKITDGVEMVWMTDDMFTLSAMVARTIAADHNPENN